MTNELTEQATISFEQHAAKIEQDMIEIKQEVAELKQWAQEWNSIIKAIADRCDDAQKRNVTLVIREVINPWAEATTVEQLLHMLESECPVITVIDALKSKELTEEESRRLASDLQGIIEDATKALARVRSSND